MCTKLGVDSSRRFPFRARTNRQTDKQTDATERRTHAGGYTAGVSNKRAKRRRKCKRICDGCWSWLSAVKYDPSFHPSHNGRHRTGKVGHEVNAVYAEKETHFH